MQKPGNGESISQGMKQRLKAKSKNSFQDVSKQYIAFCFSKPAGFWKQGPGNIMLLDDPVFFSGVLGPGAVSGW